MNIYEIIKNRYSVRDYKPDPIPEDKLQKILEAVRLAPSAHNAQDWKFIIIKNKETKKQLARAAGQNFIEKAPVIIAGVSLDADHLMSNEVPAYAVDLSIALSYLTLAAVEEGLGTCWIGGFNQEEVKKILKIPKIIKRPPEELYKVVALIPIGYPKDKPSPKIRKPLKEIICEEKFEGAPE